MSGDVIFMQHQVRGVFRNIHSTQEVSKDNCIIIPDLLFLF